MKAQLIGALLKFVVGVVGGYLLIETMVRKTGLRTRTDNEAFLPYLLMLVPYTLGVMLGLIVFILPGLIIMARWSIAQPLLVARGDRPMQALGESWKLTKGNSVRLFLFYLLLIIVYIVAAMVLGAVLGALTLALGPSVALTANAIVSGLLSAVVTVVFVAVFAAVHRQLSGPSAAAVSQTFE